MNGRKKILLLEYFPFMGGGQRVLLDLAEGLKNYYEVEILAMNRGIIESEGEKFGIKVNFIKAPEKAKYRYIIGYTVFFLKLVKFLSDNNFSLVYAGSMFAAKLAGPACFVKKIPMLWHKQLIIEKPFFSYNASQARLVSAFAAKIICVSQASRISMEKAGVNPGKIAVIYNGTKIFDKSMKKARDNFRKKFRVDKKFVCGTVCIFRRNKGLEALIETAGIISKLRGDIKFALVGRADLGEEKLRAMVREKGLGNFIFCGYGDKYAFMPGFDLYVMPSPNEPFGLVTIEAMGLGIAAAGFNRGGTAEIITNGKDGFLAKDATPEALAEKILYAYDNRKKLKAVSEKALKTVKERFSLEKQAELFREIIEGLIK
jgi:glycosyltransferase involved in cell wall biosynthesis